jgi:hypothetical protein
VIKLTENIWFRWSVRLLLAAYVVLLIRPELLGLDSEFPVISLGELLDRERLQWWLRAVGQRECWRFLAFGGLGILVAWNVAAIRAARRRPDADGQATEPPEAPTDASRATRDATEATTSATKDAPAPETPGEQTVPSKPTLHRCPWLVFVAILIAITVATVVGSVAAPWHQLVFEWVPIWLGCLLGVWIGCRLLQGWQSIMRLVAQLLMLFIMLTIALGWSAFALLEEAPLDFEQVKVTSAEKRRLLELIANRDRPTTSTRSLRLSEFDTNLLLAWGLSIGSDARQGRVTLDERSFEAELSIAVARETPWQAYLNVTGAGELDVDSGTVHLEIATLKIGRLRLPACVTGWVSRGILAAIEADAEVSDVVSYVEQLTIQPHSLNLVTRRGFLRRQFRSKAIAQLGSRSEVAVATRAYIHQLVAMREALPEDRDQQFLRLMQASFQLARQRAPNSDARLENGAAILAAAITLGHPGIERLVGSVMNSQTRRETRRLLGRPTLRGRSDWTRHFWISAAAAVLYGEKVSDAIGLLKEELDAGPRGSGFSFSDLAADMAGTRFGLLATQDTATALSLQRYFGSQCKFADFFPPAANLPEGLTDRELHEQFGGLEGPAFQQLVSEIRQRLAELPDF